MDHSPVAPPSAEELQAYSLGKLDPQRAAQIEAYLAAGPDCSPIFAAAPPDALLQHLCGTDARSADTPALCGSGTLPYIIPDAASGSPAASTAVPLAAATSAGGQDAPDTLLAGFSHPRYRLIRLLGQGGMGAVYLAEHRVMNRQVALKLIRPEFLTNPAMAERFRREVRAAASLDHPNIVRAFDAEDFAGTHFLVMEYVEGVSFDRLLAARGPLPAVEACAYIRQAALGLQFAHERGLVHRDLKPANLMLQTNPDTAAAPVVKVLDFGLAHMRGEMAAAARLAPENASQAPSFGLGEGQGAQPASRVGQLTAVGAVMGTADYMAPEQCLDSRRANIRADIYSLGCTLYHLLAGRVPFAEGSTLDKMTRHCAEQPDPLSRLRPDLAPALVRVIEKMMAKDPDQRYQTPAEVATALEPFAQARRSAPRRRVLVAVLAALLMLVGAAGVVTYRIQTDTGELVIVTNNDDVEVLVKQGGKLVRIIDTKTNKEIALYSGTYELEIKGKPSGLKLVPEKVTLTRGDVVLATIEVRKKPRAGERMAEADQSAGLLRLQNLSGALILDVQFSPDGRHFLVSRDYTIGVWEVATGKLVHSPGGWLGHFTSDSQRIVTEYQFGFNVYDAATGQLQKRIPAEGRLYNFRLSPDGKWICAVYSDYILRLINVETGKELHRWKCLPFKSGGGFDADGKHLFLVQNAKPPARVIDLETGNEVQAFQAIVSKVPFGYWWFTKDGQRMVIWDYLAKRFVITEVATGKDLKTIPLGEDQETGPNPAVAPDAKRAVTVHNDGTVRAWDLATGKEIARHTFSGATDTAHVAISNDGRYAALGRSSPARVYLWRLPDAK
jgi:WD40 repeat protein/tRNA A-37 threonylcarbamoyl transferase component Bud32